MRLDPPAEAVELARAVGELLDRAADAEALRAAWDSGDGHVPGLSKRLAEVGVTGLTVGEEHGGGGVDATWALPVLVELGRHAAPEPFVETLAAVALLSTSGGDLAGTWLPRIADGSATVTVAPRPGALVVGADTADLVLAVDGGSVRALTGDEAERIAVATVDRGLRLAEVRWADGAGQELPGADVPAAYDLAVVASAAELLGLAQAMLEMAVAYAKTREQFGRAIGSFQAVKHQLADVHVAVAFAAPVVARGTWSVAHALRSRARDASHAKHAATLAAQGAARTALQVHGGIGYTYEHQLHMWLKRTLTRSTLWGDAVWHRARVAADVLSGAPAPRVP